MAIRNNKRLIYPVITSEFNDDGHYFVVTSSNIKEMVTQGGTAEEAIAIMLDGTEYPEPQDPSDWEVKDNGINVSAVATQALEEALNV